MKYAGKRQAHCSLSFPLVRGFTLVELMVVIAILAIMLSLAVPSFQSTIASSRLSSAKNDFLTTLAQARSNAIRAGHRVTVCKSANGKQCTTAGGWEQGWISFTDTARASNDATVDAGEVIITTSAALPAGVVINGNMPYVSYAADGQPKSMNGSLYGGTMRICSTSAALSDATRARDLTISTAGRIAFKALQPTVTSACPEPS